MPDNQDDETFDRDRYNLDKRLNQNEFKIDKTQADLEREREERKDADAKEAHDRDTTDKFIHNTLSERMEREFTKVYAVVGEDKQDLENFKGSISQWISKGFLAIIGLLMTALSFLLKELLKG